MAIDSTRRAELARGHRLAPRAHRWVAVVSLLGACGGGSDGPKPQMAPPSSDSPAESSAVDLENYIVLGENLKARPIAPLFESFAQREIEALSNPMRSNLVVFAERPVIEKQEVSLTQAPVDGAAGPTPEELAEAEADPLRQQSLDRYQLIILATGTPQPKAVVLDPQGNRYDLVRGTALGKEGGRVTAILQYKMLVSMPGKPLPVEVSIAPPLADLPGVEQDGPGEL